MLTALCREQVVRTVFGDDVPPNKIYSATFDILVDDPSAVATNGKRMVYSGLTFERIGSDVLLSTRVTPGGGAFDMGHVDAGRGAFLELKW